MTNPIFARGLAEPEGPVVLADGRIALVEMGAARKGVTIAARDGAHETLTARSGNPNGLAIDGDGCFWVAGGPGQSLIRLSRSGEILTRIDGDGARAFLWPNDLAFGPDGLLYLTDSGIAPEVMLSSETLAKGFEAIDYDGRVYRIDPRRGVVLETLAAGIRFTNGIAFDPRGVLYYNETISGLVYRLEDGRAPEPYANVVRSRSGRFKGPDGMAFAADGALYCAVMGEGLVCVVAPDGAVEAWLETNGAQPTNVAFDLAERAIHVTDFGEGTIETIAVDRAGLELHAPAID